MRLLETKPSGHLHAAELEAVSISLVMGGQVVVVENPDAEHSGVNASTQEEDCDEARHLVERSVITNQFDKPVGIPNWNSRTCEVCTF